MFSFTFFLKNAIMVMPIKGGISIRGEFANRDVKMKGDTNRPIDESNIAELYTLDKA